MILKKRTACPLCHSENVKPFKKGTFDPEKINSSDFKITDSNYGSMWTFFSCKKCGFVFANPYVPEEKIIEFYSQLEDYEYSSEAEGRAKNFKTILKRLNKIEKPGNTLLDVGAASGIFLDLCQKEGYESSGIEPSRFLVDEAERLYGLKLFQGTIDDFKPQKKFAVITLLDIIEHLTDPGKFMTKILPMLEDKGVLIFVTPDINSFAARFAGKRWWHYRTAHVNFFNLKSITYLLEKHNCKIIKRKRYAWNFSLYYLLTRIFPSFKKKKPGTLQKIIKSINLKLQLFDSWEIYAEKNPELAVEIIARIG